MFCFLLFLIYYPCKLLSTSLLCPATSLYDTLTDGYLSYPTDFLFDNQLVPTSVTCNTCEDHNTHCPNVRNTCYPKSCPLRLSPSDITKHVFKSMAPWYSQTPNLADIFKEADIRWEKIKAGEWKPSKENAIPSKPEINMIILGGSMTGGNGAMNGCCCDDYAHCPKESACSLDLKLILPNKACSWSAHLYRWMRAAYPKYQINYVNIAGGGATSLFMSQGVESTLTNQGLKDHMSRADLLFIDHSVNDAYGDNGDSSIAANYGFEILVRRIFDVCGESCPNIVVLDMFLHNGAPKPEKPAVVPGTVSYAYRETSRYYRLHYWSYKDLMWSDDMSTAHPIKANTYIKQATAHPVWPVHALIADILANCMLSALSRPSHGAPHTLSTLPKPLRDLSDASKNMCAVNVPHLLDYNPKLTRTDLKFSHNLTAYESLHTSLGWVEYMDHRNGVGLIINNQAPSETYSKSFPIALPTNASKFIDMNFVVQISYLQSYRHVGKLYFTVCGGEKMFSSYGSTPDAYRFDALRPNVKLSIPTTHFMSFSRDDKNRCDAAPPEKRMLTIHYAPCSFDCASRSAFLRREKMKIFSVTICPVGS